MVFFSQNDYQEIVNLSNLSGVFGILLPHLPLDTPLHTATAACLLSYKLQILFTLGE